MGSALRATGCQLVFLGITLAAAPAAARGPHRAYPPDPPAARLSIGSAFAAIIVDDIGYRKDPGERAARLAGEITYAVLPQTPYARHFADLLHRRGKEILLHLPMEPMGHANPGPGALRSGMARDQITAIVRRDLETVPHAVGVNNHMGSRVTGQLGPMSWLMSALSARHLFYVDSRTTSHSVSRRAARRAGVGHLARDVFLDHRRDRAQISAQLGRLIDTARRRGTAIGIAHPYPETLAVLESAQATLAASGVRLVYVSRLFVLGSPPANGGRPTTHLAALRATRSLH